ncbi:cytochrome c [Paracoccus sp. S-4012]|uniref:c-type cytochrome n=1 Tax=Paracoccus sp. S-4012 TaxID=2665648 RepID=UPI0012B0A212|nr:cytochrome c [Paracoccus sp. S-4012]MRX50483.1 cytochrome c [Paracoccus sp. S-4012]
MAERRLRGAALAVAATLAAGAAPTGEISAERAAQLQHMVVQDCGSCHGLTMKGGLGTAITPEALAGRDPEGLAEIVLDGIPGTAMPPWRPLITEAEALWIARWLLEDKTE